MQVLVWALVNDAIDYQELQTGERNEGIMYSAYSFFRKLANGVSWKLLQFCTRDHRISGIGSGTDNRSCKPDLENIHRKLCDRIWSGSVGIVPALPAWKEENTGNAGDGRKQNVRRMREKNDTDKRDYLNENITNRICKPKWTDPARDRERCRMERDIFQRVINLHGSGGMKAGYKGLHITMARALAEEGIGWHPF